MTTPSMNPPDWTFTTRVSFRTGRKGRKRLRVGGAPVPVPVEPGHVPRVARLLALAHRMRELVDRGDVRSYADLARLARVTRPRATQILNLLLLAPDLQEAVLHLPRVVDGRDPVTERSLRPIVATPDWGAQRALWRALVGTGSERVVLEVSADPGPHVSRGVAMGAAPARRST